MGTWIMGIVLAVLLVVGAVVGTNASHHVTQERAAYSESVVGNMMVYRNHVVAYATAHPEESGTIDDADLNLPTWFRRNTSVVNYVDAGRAYVYYNEPANNGEASRMLKEASNDINVGINKSQKLYNPISGETSIVLPDSIPDGVVVFASSDPSTADAPADPTDPPEDCTVAAGTSRSWTVGGNSCSSVQATTVVVAHLAKLGFTDAAPGTTGAASFYCLDGDLQTTPDDGATCNPPPPCNVAANTARSWSVGAASCSGKQATAISIDSGDSLTVTSNNGNTGAADYLCTEGVLATTPTTKSCTVPAAPCTLPSPSTQTNTNTRTATQSVNCAAGYAGKVSQSRTEQQTQTRTAYCPMPTGAYAWNAWSAWSAWSATTGWTTTSNTCVACPAATTESQTQWVAASAACPSGQTGSHTWQKEQKRTRSKSYNCPAGTAAVPAPTYGAWSAWADTGNKKSDSNTCSAPFAVSKSDSCYLLTKMPAGGWQYPPYINTLLTASVPSGSTFIGWSATNGGSVVAGQPLQFQVHLVCLGVGTYTATIKNNSTGATTTKSVSCQCENNGY